MAEGAQGHQTQGAWPLLCHSRPRRESLLRHQLRTWTAKVREAESLSEEAPPPLPAAEQTAGKLSPREGGAQSPREQWGRLKSSNKAPGLKPSNEAPGLKPSNEAPGLLGKFQGPGQSPGPGVTKTPVRHPETTCRDKQGRLTGRGGPSVHPPPQQTLKWWQKENVGIQRLRMGRGRHAHHR